MIDYDKAAEEMHLDKIADELHRGNIITPSLKDIAGPTLSQFPEGHDIPYTVLLREAYMKYGDKGPTEINIPRYGVLYLDGRNYSFEFDEKYAARKGYEPVKEGTWN